MNAGIRVFKHQQLIPSGENCCFRAAKAETLVDTRPACSSVIQSADVSSTQAPSTQPTTTGTLHPGIQRNDGSYCRYSQPPPFPYGELQTAPTRTRFCLRVTARHWRIFGFWPSRLAASRPCLRGRTRQPAQPAAWSRRVPWNSAAAFVSKLTATSGRVRRIHCITCGGDFTAISSCQRGSRTVASEARRGTACTIPAGRHVCLYENYSGSFQLPSGNFIAPN